MRENVQSRRAHVHTPWLAVQLETVRATLDAVCLTVLTTLEIAIVRVRPTRNGQRPLVLNLLSKKGHCCGTNITSHTRIYSICMSLVRSLTF